MATSTINLYYDCKIVPERIMKVEQISSYLATLSKDTISRFQYIKHALNLEIKISSDQIQLMNFQSVNFNYCSIVNNLPATPSSIDDIPHYYFIISKKWIAQDTIKLVLKLDTLNTFYDKLSFNPRTKVLREHKACYVKTQNGIKPVIDFNSEGLMPTLYNSKSGYYANKKIIEKSGYNIDWYLIYHNVNTPSSEVDIQNPVQFYLATSESKTIPAYTGVLKPILFASDNYKCLAFCFGDNGAKTIKVYYTKNSVEYYETYTLNSLVVADNNHHIKLKSIAFDFNQSPLQVLLYGNDTDDNNTPYQWLRWPEGDNNLTWDKAETDCMYARNFNDYNPLLSYPTYCDSEEYLIRFSNGYGSFDTFNIAGVDRTDSRVIKVIKIPYCPDEFLNTPRVLSNQFRVMYEDGGRIRGLTNGLISFSNSFKPLDTSGNEIKPFEFLKAISTTPDYWSQDGDDDPKLFHSEFFCVKLVYDSFVLNLPAEALGVNGTRLLPIDDNFSLTFKMSTTMNSRFMWKVDNYSTIYGSENFDSVLCVSRNNELPIYTSAYLNYIRTGYNYDLKAKTVRETATWLGVLGAGVGGAVAGASAGGVVGAIGGGVVGVLGGLVGAITSTIQAENTFNKNMQSLEWQTNSVRDSNDVDLMSEYCGNRLQVFYYECSPKVRNQVRALFKYFGYKSDRVGIPTPNIKIGWDFLQCEAEFNKNNYNISEEYINDVKTQLEAGATFFHYITAVEPDTSNHWDLDQLYDNWDKAIM